MKVQCIIKAHSQFLVLPIRQTTNPMAWKCLPDTIILSEVYQMEEFSNQIKNERMVSNHFTSCNSEQLKISLKIVHNS